MDTFLQKILRPYRGSNRLSFFLRSTIERLRFRELLGLQLAAASFFAAVVVPQVGDIASQVQILQQTDQVTVEVVPTEAAFRWPLTRFGISQRYSPGHPGIDLTDPKGTPIYAIAAGTVAWTNTFPWGYGKHLLIDHGDGKKSLYAHLSRLDVAPGDLVTKDTQVGEVGSTGWATGNHLHLEIFQEDTPVNPIEVLPNIK